MVDSSKKLTTNKFRINRKIFGGELYYRVVFCIYFILLIAVNKQPDTGINQESPEYIQHPMKMADERRTHKYKQETHDYCADNAP